MIPARQKIAAESIQPKSARTMLSPVGSSLLSILLIHSSIRISSAFVLPTRSSPISFSSTSRILKQELKSNNGIQLNLNKPKTDDDNMSCNTNNKRRDFLVSFAAISVGASSFAFSQPSVAAYGDSSTIEFPSYIDFLIEKNKVVDSSTFIYQGPDTGVLLKRIAEASLKLRSVPELVEQKKWSQVQGILTGPLGTLVQTMNQISNAEQKKEVTEAAKKVKADLLAISQAASKKDGALCLKVTTTAVEDLDSFAKLAF